MKAKISNKLRNSSKHLSHKNKNVKEILYLLSDQIPNTYPNYIKNYHQISYCKPFNLSSIVN
jgi:hypothetical protein